jgi:hypothetical protein
MRYIRDYTRDEGPVRRLERVLAVTQPSTFRQFGMLDELYAGLLQKAAEVVDAEEHELSDRLRMVFGFLASVQQPLALDELSFLLPDSFDATLLRLTLDRVASVVQLENQTPQYFHRSFPDFLTDPRRCQDTRFYVEAERYNHLLAVRCLRIMNSTGILRYDICNIRDPHLNNWSNLNPEVPTLRHLTHLENAVRPAEQYACMHWMKHVTQLSGLDVEGADDCGPALRTFCNDHLLHWLEIQALLGEIPSARDGLHDTVLWCTVSDPPSFAGQKLTRRY